MAEPKKPGNQAPKRGRAQTKPTTIDLAAKDVSEPKTETSPKTQVADTKATAAKTTSSVPKTGTAKTSSTETSSNKASAASTADKKTSTTTAAKTAKPNEKPSTETKTATTPPPPPKAKSSSGIFGGLVGACLAILGLGTVGQYDGASQIPLIGSIFSSQNSQSTAQSSDQIAALTARIDELAANGGSNASSDSSAIDALNAKITELENNVSSTSSNGGDGKIEELEAKLTDISSTVSSLSGGGSSDNNSDLSEVTNRLAELEEQISGLYAPDLTPIRDAIATVEAELKAVQEEIAKNSGSIGSVGELVSGLDNDMKAIKVSSKVAKSVAVNALGSALQNDDPLFIPISSLEALNGVTEETTRLGELARAGIPTVNELVGGIDALAENIQNPVTTSEDASITDKLWANARSLVTVRTSGPQQGDSVPAVLSRVKSNLKESNLTEAENEWKRLPPQVATANEAWLSKLQTRMEAFSIYKKLSSELSENAS